MDYCRVGHDVFGSCEREYKHDGPHWRTPGGAALPNRWYGTTCPCCKHIYGPAVEI